MIIASHHYQGAELQSFGEVVQCRVAPFLIPAFSHRAKEEDRQAIAEDAGEEALRKVLRVGTPALAGVKGAMSWRRGDALSTGKNSSDGIVDNQRYGE